MSRLVFVFLLSTAIVQGTLKDDALKINRRFVELFNAERFSELVEELFHEEAFFYSTDSPGPVEGHDDIAAHLKVNAEKYGNLWDLEIVDAGERGTIAKLNQGTHVQLTIKERFKDSKFFYFYIEFAEK